MAVPAVNMIEIGAGGGSIAGINAMGLVQVGPESAGADPGPICYGRGGTRPTVTDADLLLGYLDPDNFAGGSMRLDEDAARDGIEEHLARPRGQSALEAAWTVHDVVNETMGAAVRMHVTERGGNPHRATLVAFGGAGPLHACHLAEKLRVGRVMVPLRAGVLSALGLLIAPPAYDIVRTHKIPLDELDAASTGALVEEMAESIASLLRRLDSEGELRFARGVDVGYIGQSYQVTVPLDGTVDREAIWKRFATLYREKYGYFYDDVPAELVNLRVLGELVGGELELAPLPEERGGGGGRGRHPARLVGSRARHACVQRLRPRPAAPGHGVRGAGHRRGSLRDHHRRRRRNGRGRRLRFAGRRDRPGGRVMSANQPPEALDIVWPRLIAIADEMATTMFRTAFSHDVVEVHDMSTGLYDDRGCLIGQTWLGATGHTGVMPVYGRNLLEYFPPETVRPGDVYICNDPWICNGQTADVFITTPAFQGERLIGFSINSVHHVDIGGRKGSGAERGGLRGGAHHSAAQALRRRRAERAALRDSAAERQIRGEDDRGLARPGGGGVVGESGARAALGGVRPRNAPCPRRRDHAPHRGRHAGGNRRSARRRVPRRDGDGDRGHRGAADARGHGADSRGRTCTPISPAPRRRCAAR